MLALQIVVSPALGIRPHQAQPEDVHRNPSIRTHQDQFFTHPLAGLVTVGISVSLELYRAGLRYNFRPTVAAGLKNAESGNVVDPLQRAPYSKLQQLADAMHVRRFSHLVCLEMIHTSGAVIDGVY